MVEAPTREQLHDARSGDQAAFGSLIAPLLHPAYQLAVAMLGDREKAEDAVQEACLTGWRKLPQLRAANSLWPWFLAIVANRCKRVRRMRWWSVIKEAEPRGSLVSPAPMGGVQATELRDACRRLGHDEVYLLTLFYCLDLPLDEVAASLGVSREAAKTRLYRAVRKLRPLLEDPEDEA